MGKALNITCEETTANNKNDKHFCMCTNKALLSNVW